MNERTIQQSLFHTLRSGRQIVLPNYTPRGWHECDLWAVTKAGYGQEYEIKTSVADFRADAKKTDGRRCEFVRGKWIRCEPRAKHDRLASGDKAGPTRFWYVVPEGLLAPEAVPEWAGLIEVRQFQYGGVGIARRADGPRLHNAKVADAVLRHAVRVAYWRFWNERELNMALNQRNAIQAAGMEADG